MKCYLCGSDNFIIKEGEVRDLKELNILECKNCGLVTLSSFSHISNNYYETSPIVGVEVLDINYWLKFAENDDQRRIDSYSQLLSNKVLLDFGCGAGGFLNKSLKFTSKSIGIEADSNTIDYWRGKIDIFKSINDVNNEKFDIITAFHVFEHLPEPILILKELASLLKPGGKIIIEVPSSNDALFNLYNSMEYKKFSYWSQHLFLFNEHTISKLGEASNLQIAAVQQYQRYPLSNHLYWLSKGLPGGHHKWSFLDTPELKSAYTKSLALIGQCDTIIAYFENKINE